MTAPHRSTALAMKQDFYRALFPKSGLSVLMKIEYVSYICIFTFAVLTVSAPGRSSY